MKRKTWVEEPIQAEEKEEVIPEIVLENDSEFEDDIDADSAPELVSEQDEDDDTFENEFLIKKYGLGYKAPIDPVYNSDTSDEETENTVGNIPMKWYDEFDHIGYDKDGRKIAKPASQDQLDQFLNNSDNAETWRSVFSELDGKSITLTKEDLDIIKRIESGAYADADYNPYEPTIEWFTSKTEVMPLSAAPEPKRRFIPSKNEAKKIMKIARAIRKGLIKPKQEQKKPKAKFYDIWSQQDNESMSNMMRIAAPKLPLPGNEYSYNPPAEYLKTKEEIEQEQKETDDPVFIPKKYDSLRKVPAFDRFIQERFERCLDLYLCPRIIKKKVQIDPESLIPKLPSPKDLEPFPSKLSMVYKGHTDKVTKVCVDPNGFWIATASLDKTVRIFEISTGRCAKVFKFDEAPSAIAWNPNKAIHLLGVAVAKRIILINPCIESKMIKEATDAVFEDDIVKPKNEFSTWQKPSGPQFKQGYRLIVETTKQVTSLSWHRKGDYFVTVTSTGNSSNILVHQISKYTTQSPFSKGMVMDVQFHPSKPFMFVATQRNVRVYDLVTQNMVKKLVSGVKWISCMDIHPQGDNVIIGSFDKRLCWFDMDLSTGPYKTLRYQQCAVRGVAFHKKYPLFGSCSDDGNVNVMHGMVYNDLMKNPLIVPLKKIKAHETVDGLGATCLEFHPLQPWLFTSGADGLVKLFV